MVVVEEVRRALLLPQSLTVDDELNMLNDVIFGSQEGKFGTRWLVRLYGAKTKANMTRTLDRIEQLATE